jgi:hypothetical protein
MVSAIWSPTTTVRALVPSVALVIVNVSVEMAVTRTISAFVVVGCVETGQMVALNEPLDGNLAPSPDWTTSDVPDVAGDGAVRTVLYPKFLCGSAMSSPPPALARRH